MKNLTNRLTWILFLLMGWIILLINGCRDKKINISFVQELKKLCKKHSKYTEDNDFIIIHKKDL